MRSELELHTTKFFELGLLGCWGVGSGEWGKMGEVGGYLACNLEITTQHSLLSTG